MKRRTRIEERRVVINMVVEEDDGRCKILLASGLWSIFPYHFYVGAGTAAVHYDAKREIKEIKSF